MFLLVFGMDAVLISYSTQGLSKTEASKISKSLKGYTDKSNKGAYIYEREGLISSLRGIVISRSTFIVPKNDAKQVIEYITSKKGVISSWNINIPKKYFKN